MERVGVAVSSSGASNSGSSGAAARTQALTFPALPVARVWLSTHTPPSSQLPTWSPSIESKSSKASQPVQCPRAIAHLVALDRVKIGAQSDELCVDSNQLAHVEVQQH